MPTYLRQRLTELIQTLEKAIARDPDRHLQLTLGLLLAADDELEKQEKDEAAAQRAAVN
jgi:hypothetical protein